MALSDPVLDLGSSFEERVYLVGSAIPLQAFQIVSGIVFALAIICAIARSVMRWLTRRPLYWDDLFLALAVACFVADTGILYKNTYYYYLSSALQFHPALAFQLTTSALDYLLTVALPELTATAACAWTTIFCVKASFLIVSKQLMTRLFWLNRLYFWSVVVFTFCSWIVLISAPFIECPYSGWTSVAKCAGNTRNTVYVAMNGVIAGLDIITDILIASIPIIILSRSKLKMEQKLVVGPFLCLSLVMIIFAAVRVSKLHSATTVDIVWLAFWQYLEAGIAIIVTSLTTVRTVFVAKRKQKQKQSDFSNQYPSDRKAAGSKGSHGVAEETVDTLIGDDTFLMSSPKCEKALPDLPTEPTKIYVHESWGVSYSEEDLMERSPSSSGRRSNNR